MKILITGLTGLIGRYWATSLTLRKHEVFGLSRHATALPGLNIPQNHILSCDLLDSALVENIIRDIQPHWILHLAAQSFNSLSWAQEELTHQTNFMGTLHLLQAVRKQCPGSLLLVAGSSVQYGIVRPEDCPIQEERTLLPVTPYGVSKTAAEMLAYQYSQNFGMKIVLPRLFAQLGAGHPPSTVIQAFAKQLALMKHKLQPPILKTGNLEAYRDFMDVRDGIAAMELLITKEHCAKPTNICSGQAVKISDLLQLLLDISGLKVKVETDSSLVRPSDEPLAYGNNNTIVKLGWKPKYSIRDALKNIYKDWIKRTDPSGPHPET